MTALLHQWEMSPFCNKVRRILAFKGISYEVQNYNGLLARNAAKLSAVGTLPVLDFDGERIVDSAAIARRLDETHPEKRCYPQDPRQLAMARTWEDWAGKSLYGFEIYFRMLIPGPLEKALDAIAEGRPRWERFVLKQVFKRRYPTKLYWHGLARLPYEEVEQQFFGHLDDLEVLLGEGDFLVGNAPTIADFSVAAQIDEILRTSEISERIRGYPNLMAWLARC